MAKKSKKFRIFVEGATSDGRKIERTWIQQIAANYDPAVYGARVNLEHIRGYDPTSLFRMYGDVLSVTAEEITDGDLKGKLGLYAEISPTDDLIAMTNARQKIYTSAEINPSFGDTKQCYLVGLAITDSPASLGTEVLSFAATSPVNPFAGRKQDAGNLFTAAEEVTFEFVDVATAPPYGPGLLERVKAMFTKRDQVSDARLGEIERAIEEVATHGSTQSEQTAKQFKTVDESFADLNRRHETLSKAFSDMKAFVDALPKSTNTQRPPATGNNGALLTDC